MENAAKALVMAGGVLIALLVIGALILMFTHLSDYQNSEDMSAKQAQIAAFNSQYEPYNKDNLTLMELKSVYNKIQSNNKKYENDPSRSDYEITCVIDSETKSNIENYTSVSEADKINLRYKCTKVEYTSKSKGNKSELGRICLMKFEKK